MSLSLSAKQYCLLGWPWIVSSGSAIIGYSMKDLSLTKRWITAFLLGKFAQHIQNYSNEVWKKVLPDIVIDTINSNYWIQLNTLFSFIMANGLVGIFGGKLFYKKHGVNNYKKAIILSLSNGQVYFKKNKNAQIKALKQLFKVFSCLGIGYVISKYLKSNPLLIKQIKSNKILNVELLGLLISFQVVQLSIPANIHYLIFGINDDIEVIQPYDFVFFSSSIRSFWKNWSRPIGEALRYSVYEPLGGLNRYWLSVPAVFFVNCTFHWDFSMNLYGYRAISEWNKGFAIMWASILLQMLSERIFLKHKYIVHDELEQNEKENIDSKLMEDNIYWKIWCFGLFNVSMAGTLHVIHEKAMITNVENVCNTLCPFDV